MYLEIFGNSSDEDKQIVDRLERMTTLEKRVTNDHSPLDKSTSTFDWSKIEKSAKVGELVNDAFVKTVLGEDFSPTPGFDTPPAPTGPSAEDRLKSMFKKSVIEEFAALLTKPNVETRNGMIVEKNTNGESWSVIADDFQFMKKATGYSDAVLTRMQNSSDWKHRVDCTRRWTK